MEKNFLHEVEYDACELTFTVSRHNCAADVTYRMNGREHGLGNAVVYRDIRRTEHDIAIRNVQIGAMSLDIAYSQVITLPKLGEFLNEREIFNRLESLCKLK